MAAFMTENDRHLAGDVKTVRDEAQRPLTSVRRAVVDIGSNSVRLVVFEGPLRAPISICNEKSLCGLGRNFLPNGRLNPEARKDALATLGRFKNLLDAYGSPPTEVIATAAIREAIDGGELVEAINALGFSVNVISGREEAELAALGVVSVEPDAKGIVGDMGGGSLELVGVDAWKLGEAVSLPIGPFSIMRTCGDDTQAAVKLIEKSIKGVPFVRKLKSQRIYAVGGAWRALARIHMAMRHYPLSVLHHYSMNRDDVIELCDLVAKQSRRSLEEIPGIARKRIDTLPLAAVALRALVNHSDAREVVVSSGGVREGALFRTLDETTRAKDPLLETCRFIAEKFTPNPAYGAAAADVLRPLFVENEILPDRILRAVCELGDIAAYAHPDLRGQYAQDAVLSTPFVGITHSERVMMAYALRCRYSGRSQTSVLDDAFSLLNWDEQQTSMRLGLALRFISTYSPKLAEPLKDCRLTLTADGLTFQTPPRNTGLTGETPQKRLDALASAFEKEARILFEV